MTADFKNVIKNKKILYENTIYLNPKWNINTYKTDPIKMAVTDKEIIISSSPLTRISLSNVREVKLNPLWQVALRIVCKDGQTYKVIWAPTNSVMPYSPFETQSIKNNLNKILEKKFPTNNKKRE